MRLTINQGAVKNYWSPSFKLSPTLLGLFVASAFAISACAVTENDIETWKTSEKGPTRLVGVLLADKYPIQMRSKAALALLELDRSDVDGTTELQNGLAKLGATTKKEVMSAVVPGLVKALDEGKVVEGEEPEPKQVRAKDAAFTFLNESPPELRGELIRALVSWYAKDFNARTLVGNATADQVMRGIGAPAAPILGKALSAELPPPVLVKLSELIGQLGDDKAKTEAGDKLIAIYKEMGQDKFVEWLKAKIAAQLKQQNPKQAPDANRVAKAAEVNRGTFMVDGALSAMKHLAGQERVADFLVDLASSSGTSDADVQRRAAALRALEGHATKKHMNAIMAIALDNNQPVPVRDDAFDRLGDIGSDAMLPKMWPLLENKSDGKLRWRAGELILSVGGPSVLSRFFSTLPSSLEEGYPPGELEGYATRVSQMKPAPSEAMKAQLHASNWAVKIIALRYFERKGEKEYVGAVKELEGDKTVLKGKGWGKDETVGSVAQITAKALGGS